MNFKFDKNGIKSYVNVLKKRYAEAERRLAITLTNNLYLISPKRTGALAGNYSITINGEIPRFDPQKIIPSYNIGKIDIKDQISIVNPCPYIMFVNYGTIYQLPQNFIERSITITKSQMPQILIGIDKIN